MPEIQITHDGTFSIALGRNRRETSWKNKEWSWSQFLSRISETHRTHETYLEYMSGKKPWQDEIKDVGGFVGGRLASGRRQRDSVACRQLVTLDLDFAPLSIWEDFVFYYGNAGAIYTTHKHSKETPRYRIIIPLDREVSADEWMAISRRIAGTMGIEIFDPTTFQAHRLMYWPSTASDGDFLMEYQDGPWMSADEVLSTYRDWRDTSEWPVSVKQGELIAHGIKKQGDPLEKPGIVGAFCRTYNIDEAIERYLSDVYEACGQEDRYSFTGGSTAGGLIVYDSKFAYSHHGTDPCSGKLCNAFDLVRIHKFGLMDEDARDGTPINKLPSFVAMQREAMKDKDVRILIGTEKLQDALEDFSEDEGAAVEMPENTDWLGDMDVDRGGNYLPTVNNVLLVLQNDPALRGVFATDCFRNREVLLRDAPWRTRKEYPYIKDIDEVCFYAYVEKKYGLNSRMAVKDGFRKYVAENSLHPVKDYLDMVKWDGEERLDALFINFLGAEDCEYIRAVTRKTFCAAVARIYAPGIKFDTMTILIGSQGIGKSTLLSKMGKDWFSDSFGSVHTKEAMEQIQGVWLMEIGELASLRNADVEAIKLFLAKQEDTYRPAYGRLPITTKRHGIMVGTTNVETPLRDKTGNRRFWPVKCEVEAFGLSVFKDLQPWYVDQIWAEAVEKWKGGETLHLTGKVAETAREIQETHLEKDEREGVIREFMEMLLPENWDEMDTYARKNYINDFKDDMSASTGTIERTRITAVEVWCELLNGHKRDLTTINTKPIHDILKRVPGWKSAGILHTANYGKQRSYVKIAEEQ